MPSTFRDPMTGEIKFKDENQVINETTGQTAQGLTASGGSSVGFGQQFTPPAQQPTPSNSFLSPEQSAAVERAKQTVAQAPFTTGTTDPGIDVANLDTARSTEDTFSFLEQAQQAFGGTQELTVPSQRELDLDQDIIRESDLLNQIQLRESALADELLSQQDFSEDRLVDIGTIRGEQAQAGRVADSKRRSLALEKQSQVNVLESFLNQKAQLVDNRTSTLANTRENIQTLLQLSQSTLPDVLQTQINEQTGEVTATVRDPQTGAISTVNAGFVTPEQTTKVSGQSAPKLFTNALGQVKVFFTDENGQIVVQDLDQNVRSTGSSGVAGEETFKDSQTKAAGFAQRMEDAESVLNKGFFIGFGEKGDNVTRKAFKQAETNFITAVLRQESGAAIGADEFATAKGTYIPSALDDEDELAAKSRARKVAIANMKRQAGGAFDVLNQSVGDAQTPSSDGLSDDEAFAEYQRVTGQ